MGFVLTSLFCSAIDRQELQAWCYRFIGELESDTVPGYLFDLAEYNGSLAKIDSLLGFLPNWKHSDDDENALVGIGMKRGMKAFEWPVSEAIAMAALARRPEVEARFRETFPFIVF